MMASTLVPTFIEELLSQMTLREKVSLLAGTNMWHTVPVERLGVPSLKMTDGPNGARGAGSLTGGVKTTCFPAEISLASTWNTDLVERVGQALADETKMKGAQVLLGPTVNIQRSPLGGATLKASPRTPISPLAWRWPTSRGYSGKEWEPRSSTMSVTMKSSSASVSVQR